jgi:hypothetical protein
MIPTDTITALNRLWTPVRPHLAIFIEELYGRNDGHVLEIGPFSGLIFELAGNSIGTSFHMTLFPDEVIDDLKKEARTLGMEDRVTISGSDDKLSAVPSGSCDLIVFRGAFFFPSFFSPDLTAVYRCLNTGGLALAGGGFGRHTPGDIIRSMESESKKLNQALGRVHITEDDLQAVIKTAQLQNHASIVTEGGLWVVLRK